MGLIDRFSNVAKAKASKIEPLEAHLFNLFY